MKRIAVLSLALALVAVPACNRGAKLETEAAVRQALERYLGSRPNLNMQGMDMQVSGIKFRDQTAEADVTFRAKGDAKAVMSIRYTLKRRSSGWEVEPQTAGHGSMAPSAGSGGAGELPGGHPPAGSTSPQTPELPAGHPPVKPK